ncbi:MAG: DUF6941 family protein [Rhodomicrobium sp.]
MPSKYPDKASIFLAADAVRQEVGGKVTLMGIFADGRIVLPAGTTFPAALPLAFFISFSDGEGVFATRLKVTDPNGRQLADAQVGNATKNPDQPMQVIINFNPFIVPSVGQYTVTLFLDKSVYHNYISVSLANSPG